MPLSGPWQICRPSSASGCLDLRSMAALWRHEVLSGRAYLPVSLQQPWHFVPKHITFKKQKVRRQRVSRKTQDRNIKRDIIMAATANRPRISTLALRRSSLFFVPVAWPTPATTPASDTTGGQTDCRLPARSMP